MTPRPGTSPPDVSRTPPRGSILTFTAGTVGITLLLFIYYAHTRGDVAGFVRALDVCPDVL